MGTVSVQDHEKALEMDGGDGCSTVNVLDATELYTETGYLKLKNKWL